MIVIAFLMISNFLNNLLKVVIDILCESEASESYMTTHLYQAIKRHKIKMLIQEDLLIDSNNISK